MDNEAHVAGRVFMTAEAPLEGRYELGLAIGRGGMGEVYRARDLRLGRDVAVKFLRDAPTADARRFESEWRTLAALSHPHLVRLYDAGESDGRAFIVMELIEGATLARVLAAGVPPVEQVGHIGASVASALAYVHGKGVIHRDVKPSNILVGDDGGVWLADFGVARLVDGTGLTATGMSIGTPAYLAPEQVAGNEVGPSADVYSLGLVLFEALAGHRAFEGTPAEVAAARLQRQPELPATLSESWRALLTNMTAREPAARPSAADVADALGGATSLDAGRLLGVPLPAAAQATQPLTVPYDAPEGHTAPLATELMPGTASPDRDRWWRRHRLLLGAAAAAIILGVVLGLLLSNGPAAKPLAASTSTTAAPTTTSTTTTTTTTTTPTTTAADPVTTAADQVLSTIQSGVSDGSIDPALGNALVGSVRPLLAPSGNTGAEQHAFDQLAQQVAQGVANGQITGAATINALAGSLQSLAGALGTTLSSTTPTAPAGPASGPPGHDPAHHHHGDG